MSAGKIKHHNIENLNDQELERAIKRIKESYQKEFGARFHLPVGSEEAAATSPADTLRKKVEELKRAFRRSRR